MKKLLFLLLVGCQITFAQKTNPNARFAGLDTAFARVLNQWKCAGFAVAVVEKDKVIYAKGFGYADFDKKISATENTQFAVGSCTKAFTCAALGILQNEGKLDFDKPAREYLPQLKFFNADLNEKVTLRDMMTHRTGLPRHDESWGLFKTKSTDTLLQRVPFLEPNVGLREKWQYNNFMYMAQGKIVEELTGKSYRAFVREKIYRPLGIVNENFSVDTMAIYKDRSLGYTVSDDDKITNLDYVDLDVMSSVGGINSSVNEMAKWAMLWLNNGKYKGQQVLPADFVREAMSSQMIVQPNFPAKNSPTLHFENYGLGWFLSSYQGHYRVEHGGNISGFSSNICMFPTDSVGIVVFCNQDVSKVTAIVRNLIADRLLKLPYKDWQTYLYAPVLKNKIAMQETQKQTLALKKEATKSSAHAVETYTGYYANAGYGKFEISLKKDSLFAHFPSNIWYLKPFGNDVFEAFEVDKKSGIVSDFSTKRIVFDQDINGEIATANIAFEATLPKAIEFVRTAKPKELTKEELSVYVGEYNLFGTPLKIMLKNEKSLFLIVPNQPEFELVAVDKNKFNFKGIAGYSVAFNKDATELSLTQPNGTFKADRKKG